MSRKIDLLQFLKSILFFLGGCSLADYGPLAGEEQERE